MTDDDPLDLADEPLDVQDYVLETTKDVERG